MRTSQLMTTIVLLLTVLSVLVLSQKQSPINNLFLRGRKLVGREGLPQSFLSSLPSTRSPQLINGQNPFEFSGYITVNQTYNSNMYYVLFPAQSGKKDAPLIMWLQGGPGCSSMDGMFLENGPYHIDKDTLRLVPNPYSWNKDYHVVYVDNPVGAGFSYTDEPGYVKDEVQVADEMFTFLNQFLPKYNLTANDFYIFGESYAGKYIPSIAHKIYFTQQPKINLRGVGIGDGLTHPVQQFVDYAEFAFNTGLIDQNQYKKVSAVQQVAKSLVEQKKWDEAMNYINEILNDVSAVYAGNVNVYDIREYGNYDTDYITTYVMQPDVREQMHTNNHRAYHDCDSETYQKLQRDMPKSVRQYVVDLLNANFKVLLYNGQFDLIINTPASERWIWDMPWNGQQQYQQAGRSIWKVNGQVAGYARGYGPLTQLVVHGAGHLAPMDQPITTRDMVDRFINNRQFN